jgi:hypothetical protein
LPTAAKRLDELDGGAPALLENLIGDALISLLRTCDSQILL